MISVDFVARRDFDSEHLIGFAFGVGAVEQLDRHQNRRLGEVDRGEAQCILFFRIVLDAGNPPIFFHPDHDRPAVRVRKPDQQVRQLLGRNASALAIEPLIFPFTGQLRDI